MLEILWEDPHGLAVNKPAGLLVHQGAEPSAEPTLEQLVRRDLRPGDPSSTYLGTVHRLDRPVSGVILWAKTPKAAHRWAEQFRDRTIQKVYWALVERDDPVPLPPGTDWEDWLAPPDRSGLARVMPGPVMGSVHAETSLQSRVWPQTRSARPVQLLEMHPRTGRTHQLRVQAASRGCPIVGDVTYGSRIPFDVGIALHARSLTVVHPIRREPISIKAEPPSSWASWGPGFDLDQDLFSR